MTIKRITFLQELLAFMGLEGRLHLEWISSAEAHKFVQVISDFTEKIKMLGPNPLPAYAAASRAFDSNSPFIKEAFLTNVVD
jgi:F420-non-reducing hydrogenase iron-sulfur subunit